MAFAEKYRRMEPNKKQELSFQNAEKYRLMDGQAMYEQTVKVLIAFDKQHVTFAMLLTSWSFSRAKPNGKKHKLL